MLRLATLKVKLYKFPDDPAHQEFCERSLYLSDCKTAHIIIFFSTPLAPIVSEHTKYVAANKAQRFHLL